VPPPPVELPLPTPFEPDDSAERYPLLTSMLAASSHSPRVRCGGGGQSEAAGRGRGGGGLRVSIDETANRRSWVHDEAGRLAAEAVGGARSCREVTALLKQLERTPRGEWWASVRCIVSTRPVWTEIYLCHACSCHEMLSTDTPRQGRHAAAWGAGLARPGQRASGLALPASCDAWRARSWILAKRLGLRVRVTIMGSPNCRNVGESQSVLITIDPIISTRTHTI
jgi:hypothetical protein